MIPEQYKSLIARLRERTDAGDVNWKPTADEKVVVVFFTDFSLTIRRDVDFTNSQPEEFVRFDILNESGSKIDGFWVDESEREFRDAMEFFEAARRKSIRLDDALSQIMGELDSDGPIGREKGKIPEDDSPPF